MVPIEQKEMRGITPKTLFWIFAGIVSIAASAIIGWYTYATKLNQNEKRIQVMEIIIEANKLKWQENEIWKVRMENNLERTNEKNKNN